MKKTVLLIFVGLVGLLFIWLYLSGYFCWKSIDFDCVVRRGTTWKSIIEAIQNNAPQKSIVVKFLCPIERSGTSRLFHKKKTFYDLWVRGGKDYTDFWRKFHNSDNATWSARMRSGELGIDAEWFLNIASFLGEMQETYIDVGNYFNVNFFKGEIFEDIKNTGDSVSPIFSDMDNHFSPSPFLRSLKKACLLNEQKEKYFGVYEEYFSRNASSNTYYRFKLFAPFLYNSVKPPDLPILNKRYRQNLSLLSNSNKVALAKQLEASLKNIKQDETLPVAGINDTKTLLALDEVVKLLEKAGIKEIHSLTAFPENPDREYLCIPVKVNAILTYDQLKSLSDAVSSASTLSIIDFLAVINCDLKPTDIKPLLEKGLPFYQARCMVIIEFITKLPDSKPKNTAKNDASDQTTNTTKRVPPANGGVAY